MSPSDAEAFQQQSLFLGGETVSAPEAAPKPKPKPKAKAKAKSELALEPESSERVVFTVTEVTRTLQAVLEEDPVLGTSLVVEGELSNVSRSARGHIYFSLRDAQASLKAVVWASMAKSLRFDLEDGMAVYVTGRLEVYAPSGTYSLVSQRIEPVGVGALQLAFQQLKDRLDAEGLFSEEWKQPLPEFPQKIGIITSRTGAVIHDMLRVIRRKNPTVDVLVSPVQVQGEGAAAAISAAIEDLNDPAYGLDLLIVARGGGSFEDLFCFSEESVVRAIFHSRVPVITGIGHEPDYSLADATADYSASTPTAAAERAVPDFEQLLQGLKRAHQQLLDGIAGQLWLLEQQFDQQVTALLTQHQQALATVTHRLDQLQALFRYEGQALLKGHEQQLARVAAELDALNPLKILARGYTVTTRPDGTPVTSAAQVTPGEGVLVRFSDGQVQCEVKAHVNSPNS